MCNFLHHGRNDPPLSGLCSVGPSVCVGDLMADPSSLRQNAAECLERADRATDPEAKATWLDMAANWLRIAGGKSRATKLGEAQQQQIQPMTDKK
jgi:hypothetical protein